MAVHLKIPSLLIIRDGVHGEPGEGFNAAGPVLPLSGSVPRRGRDWAGHPALAAAAFPDPPSWVISPNGEHEVKCPGKLPRFKAIHLTFYLQLLISSYFF